MQVEIRQNLFVWLAYKVHYIWKLQLKWICKIYVFFILLIIRLWLRIPKADFLKCLLVYIPRIHMGIHTYITNVFLYIEYMWSLMWISTQNICIFHNHCSLSIINEKISYSRKENSKEFITGHCYHDITKLWETFLS